MVKSSSAEVLTSGAPDTLGLGLSVMDTVDTVQATLVN